ncbi:MAG TPA: hypothetical protein DER33_10425 [Syntrophomonas sp.]|nr:hypothetical protein [Syntrophomonas sp.]
MEHFIPDISKEIEQYATETVFNRTPDMIATEINSIKSQTRIMVLCNSIEIGRRLVEAKEMLPHGEWGKWLETSVDYSQSTANNLMRIFEEYGATQLSLFGSEAKSQAIGSLSYTQAVALLGVPADEREKFIEEHDIDNMSTRELQQAIKERDQAIKAKEESDKKLQDANRAAEELKKAQQQAKQEIDKLQTSLAEAKTAGNEDKIEKLKAELEEADAQLLHANEEIDDLNKQLISKPVDVQAAAVVDKLPEEIENELAELRQLKQNRQIEKYSDCFKVLVADFRQLLTSLAEIEQADPGTGEKYKHATLELISQMSARL